jgi:hypothetical protein
MPVAVVAHEHDELLLLQDASCDVSRIEAASLFISLSTVLLLNYVQTAGSTSWQFSPVPS